MLCVDLTQEGTVITGNRAKAIDAAASTDIPTADQAADIGLTAETE